MKTLPVLPRLSLTATLVLTLLMSTAFAGINVDSHRPSSTGAPEQTHDLRKTPEPDLIQHLRLDPVADDEIRALLERNQQQKRLEIGLSRELAHGTFDLPSLHWSRLEDGGRVAHVVLHSPQASALRAGLRPRGLPKGSEIRFFAADRSDQVSETYGANRMSMLANQETELYWSPVMHGERLGMELYLPAEAPLAGHSLMIPRLSHLLTSAEKGFQLKNLGQLGNSGACNVDVNCEEDADWRETGESVAKYFFTTSSGSTSMCTGTLLNDTDSSETPWFLTANHCVDNQNAASSMVTYWFFQREECGGADPTSVISRNNGANLLATGTNTDFTLVQLNDTPPDGVVFAGWSTTMPPLGDIVTAIHHPSGDIKKISFGDVQGYSGYGGSGNDPEADYLRVIWSLSGTTEPGSSGSALFADDYRVIGNLHGGAAACSGDQDNGLPDWYGRFDYSHNCLADWLGGEPGGECEEDDLVEPPERGEVRSLESGVSRSGSVVQGEWSDYSIEVSSGTSRLTVRLNELTADGDLYVRRGNLPQSSSFDCRPFLGGTSEETCEFDNPQSGTWYVSVHGYEATSYTVRATVSSGGGGSSSGCSLAQTTRPDPLLWLLLGLAGLAVLARRRHSGGA
ncbi:serine protease [Natronospira bacteriovora]|uniref:Serine protease n=1 Tax=Natronospira bacteriovora TaxID=3069753 RepID=A0ABU0W6E8_9GAMM|nr:serine protease [Natronospira sp. AB-CW4]MDQ2069605.1 serine protease [Natronospira sp. AB-CW4]